MRVRLHLPNRISHTRTNVQRGFLGRSPFLALPPSGGPPLAPSAKRGRERTTRICRCPQPDRGAPA